MDRLVLDIIQASCFVICILVSLGVFLSLASRPEEPDVISPPTDPYAPNPFIPDDQQSRVTPKRLS